MNTNGVVAVVLNRAFKVAQYNQYDSMPSGHGEVVLDFLKTMNKDEFVEKLIHCNFATAEERNEMKKHEDETPVEFDTATGADILKHIAESKHGLTLKNYIGFAYDSLCCEWLYLIDLDKNVLEVYKGENTAGVAPDARFLGEADNYGYYPVALAMVYSLDSLPDLETFIMDLDPESLDEE